MKLEAMTDLKIQTYQNRKNELIKSAIELSKMYNVNINLLIQDNKANIVDHYASDPELNITSYFDQK